MEQKAKLQAEIKVMQKYREEADALINKMNASTEKVNISAEMEIKKIKERIEKDVLELKQYISDDVYSTRKISLYNYVEKEKGSNGEYPIAHLEIQFREKVYSIDSDTGLEEYEIAIVETCHSYSPVYADGHWADEFPNVVRKRRWGKDRNVTAVIEILCRNWNDIINGAYAEIKRAYQNDTESKLKKALNAQEKAVLRYEALSNVN